MEDLGELKILFDDEDMTEESSGAHAQESHPSNSVKVKRVLCNLNHFTCHSGQCIDVMLVCDGMQDCSDASDEANCVQIMSPTKR